MYFEVFSKIKLKGYMGINADLSVNNFLIPSTQERKLSLSPKEIYLINNEIKNF